MEPENRPYVGTGTDSGDTGTKKWADTLPDSPEPGKRGDAAARVRTTNGDGVVDGSPADQFINHPKVIDARNDAGDGPQDRAA